jgi:hypothetical protein
MSTFIIDEDLSRAAAIAEITDKACRWGENFEEGFTERAEADWTDEKCAEIAEASEFEADEVQEVRDLWRAIALLQKGGPTKDDATVGAYFARMFGEAVEIVPEGATYDTLTDCPLDSNVGRMSRDAIDAAALLIAHVEAAGQNARMRANVANACRYAITIYFYG